MTTTTPSSIILYNDSGSIVAEDGSFNPISSITIPSGITATPNGEINFNGQPGSTVELDTSSVSFMQTVGDNDAQTLSLVINIGNLISQDVCVLANIYSKKLFYLEAGKMVCGFTQVTNSKRSLFVDFYTGTETLTYVGSMLSSPSEIQYNTAVYLGFTMGTTINNGNYEGEIVATAHTIGDKPSSISKLPLKLPSDGTTITGIGAGDGAPVSASFKSSALANEPLQGTSSFFGGLSTGNDNFSGTIYTGYIIGHPSQKEFEDADKAFRTKSSTLIKLAQSAANNSAFQLGKNSQGLLSNIVRDSVISLPRDIASRSNYLTLTDKNIPFSGNGVSTYLSSGFTLEAWVKIPQNTTAGTFISLDLYTNDLTGTPWFSLPLSISSGAFQGVTVPGSGTDQWVHLSLILSASQTGTLQSTATTSVTVSGYVSRSTSYAGSTPITTTTISGITVPANASTTTIWNLDLGNASSGAITGLRAYTTALTEAEIEAHALADAVSAGILPASWYLDMNLGANGSAVVDNSDHSLAVTTPNSHNAHPSVIGSEHVITLTSSSMASGDGVYASATTDLSRGFTISAWFKQTAAVAAGDSVALLGSTGSSWIPSISLGDSGQIIFSDGTTTTSSLSGLWTQNEWVHIAVSVNQSGKLTFYKNGQLMSTDHTTSLPVGKETYKLYIGSNGAGADWAGGKTTGIRLYNIGLGQADIQTVMAEDNAAAQAFDPFLQFQMLTDDGVITDASINQFPVTAYAGVNLDGPVVEFTGESDSYLDLPTLYADFSYGFTIDCWVQIGTPTIDSTIVYLSDGAVANTISLGIDITRYVTLQVGATTLTSNSHLSTTASPAPWTHVLVSVDSSKNAVLYVDGVSVVLSGTTVSALPSSSAVYSDFSIGAAAGTTVSANLTGNLCSLRLYSYGNSNSTIISAQANTDMLADAQSAAWKPYLVLQSAVNADGAMVDVSQSQSTFNLSNATLTDRIINSGSSSPTFTSQSSINFSGGLVLQAWVKTSSLPSSGHIIEAQVDSNSLGISWEHFSSNIAPGVWFYASVVYETTKGWNEYAEKTVVDSSSSGTNLTSVSGITSIKLSPEDHAASLTGIRCYNIAPPIKNDATAITDLIEANMLADAKAAGIEPFLAMQLVYDSIATNKVQDLSDYKHSIQASSSIATDFGSGPAMSFDCTNGDYLVFGDTNTATDANYPFPAPFNGYTIECWVQFKPYNQLDVDAVLMWFSPDIAGSSTANLKDQNIILGSTVSTDDDGNTQRFLVCEVYKSKSGATSSNTATTVQSIPLSDSWVHVACTLDSGLNITGLSVFGIPQTTITGSTGIFSVANPQTNAVTNPADPTTTACCFIGANSRATTYFLNGKLSGVRIYNRLLDSDEIQADLIADAGPTNFSQNLLVDIENSYPLDFALVNQFQDQPTLYTRLPTQSLDFTIENTSRGTLTIPAVTGTVPGSEQQTWYQQQAAFYLMFKPGTLWETGITLEDAQGSTPSANSLINDLPGTTAKLGGAWTLVYDQWRTDHQDGYFLLNDSGSSFTLPPFTPLEFRLTKIQVDGRSGARGTEVELKYSHITSSDADIQYLTGSRKHYLSILDESPTDAAENLPVRIGIVGSNTIANDTTTANTILIRLYNQSGDSLILGDAAKITIAVPYNSAGNTDGNSVWGIVTSSNQPTATTKDSSGSDWSDFSFATDSDNNSLTSATVTNSRKATWAQGAFIDITLTLKSSAAIGSSQIQVGYSGFGDIMLSDIQYLDVIKSPLVIPGAYYSDSTLEDFASTTGINVYSGLNAKAGVGIGVAAPSSGLQTGNVGVGIGVAPPGSGLQVGTSGIGINTSPPGSSSLQIGSGGLTISNDTLTPPSSGLLLDGAMGIGSGISSIVTGATLTVDGLIRTTDNTFPGGAPLIELLEFRNVAINTSEGISKNESNYTAGWKCTVPASPNFTISGDSTYIDNSIYNHAIIGGFSFTEMDIDEMYAKTGTTVSIYPVTYTPKGGSPFDVWTIKADMPWQSNTSGFEYTTPTVTVFVTFFHKNISGVIAGAVDASS